MTGFLVLKIIEIRIQVEDRLLGITFITVDLILFQLIPAHFMNFSRTRGLRSNIVDIIAVHPLTVNARTVKQHHHSVFGHMQIVFHDVRFSVFVSVLISSQRIGLIIDGHTAVRDNLGLTRKEIFRHLFDTFFRRCAILRHDAVTAADQSSEIVRRAAVRTNPYGNTAFEKNIRDLFVRPRGKDYRTRPGLIYRVAEGDRGVVSFLVVGGFVFVHVGYFQRARNLFRRLTRLVQKFGIVGEQHRVDHVICLEKRRYAIRRLPIVNAHYGHDIIHRKRVHDIGKQTDRFAVFALHDDSLRRTFRFQQCAVRPRSVFKRKQGLFAVHFRRHRHYSLLHRNLL